MKKKTWKKKLFSSALQLRSLQMQQADRIESIPSHGAATADCNATACDVDGICLRHRQRDLRKTAQTAKTKRPPEGGRLH
ncbi:MAG: hypothetical protein DI635_08380 [Pseudoxanthomonas suwonensis]|nr:MAG: hypothetical protein DI635_08380 [Pseudoxanthomonas suwonensis]